MSAAPAAAPHVLWGMPASLYTAKARACLRKRRVPFEERVPGDPRFAAGVVPEVGRWIIPVLQAPDGTLVQDGAVIVDHVDAIATAGPPSLPPDPALAAIARLLELFGGEGLLRPAMHYRWNFDADNAAFLRADFGASLAPPGAGPDARDAAFERAAARMRRAAIGFGVVPETVPTIERAFAELLGLLERHFETTPYLLGAAPTVADYGLYAPFGPHLGRDPHPASLVKRTAPRTWRWIERTGSPDDDAGEYAAPRAWLDPARPGDTLEALLRHVAVEFLPELAAQVAFADDWLARRPDLPAGTNGLPRPGDRAIGRVAVDWRGHRIEVVAMPYRLWLLQRFQDAAAALDAPAAAGLRALLERTGLSPMPTLRCRRRVERHGHVEVWGPPR